MNLRELLMSLLIIFDRLKNNCELLVEIVDGLEFYFEVKILEKQEYST